MYEAELTFQAAGPIAPTGTFVGETTYADVYFDRPDGTFYASGRELRLRRVEGRTILTVKNPPFDPASRSKEEWETAVDDGEVMETILGHLGFVRKVAFTKHCRLFRDRFQGLDLTVTVVTVDFAPLPFVEIEHLAAEREAGLAALPILRAYAAGLGLTTASPACYTDLCLAARSGLNP